LRVLPLVSRYDGEIDIVSSVFRAAAITRFAAKYPSRLVEATAAAAKAEASVLEDANVARSANSAAAAYAGYAAYAAANAVANVETDMAFYEAAAHATAYAAAAVPDIDIIIHAEINADALLLQRGAWTPIQLANAPLWRDMPQPRIGGAWQGLAQRLRARGTHWSIWIDWYDDVLVGKAADSEEYDAAFTDILGELPWDKGAEAVNTEIARRLAEIFPPKTSKSDADLLKEERLKQLTEVASPQAFLNDKDQLDAGPNQPFDVPAVDDDLSTLPLRQRNLIKGILRDIPSNAPKHLKDFLRSYDEELKARGTQPILGILKDSADIIAAAVAAPRAEDEWLEPGMRKAFDLFAENHVLFVKHFPLDVKREKIYARMPLDEDQATGKKLVEPFEIAAKAAGEAHKAGKTTDEFLAVIDKMTEFARVLSTQPTAPPAKKNSAEVLEIKITPDDRIQPVTPKQRLTLSAIGFFIGAINLISSGVTISGYQGLGDALVKAKEMLSQLIR
jgi:hypothetical protein